MIVSLSFDGSEIKEPQGSVLSLLKCSGPRDQQSNLEFSDIQSHLAILIISVRDEVSYEVM